MIYLLLSVFALVILVQLIRWRRHSLNTWHPISPSAPLYGTFNHQFNGTALLPESIQEAGRLTHLTCVFARDTLLQDLRALRTVVSQLAELEELDLQFPQGSFTAHADVSQGDQDAVHNAFHDVMDAMIAKCRGPAIYLSPALLSGCPAQDLSKHHFNPRYIPTKKDSTSLFSSHWSTPIQASESRVRMAPDWEEQNKEFAYPFEVITSMKVRHLWSSSVIGAYKSATFFITNLDKISNISFSSKKISGHHLNAIAAHLTLPDLSSLEIHSSSIDPALLSQFITRHPKIQAIDYGESESYTGQPLISPVVSPAALNILNGGSATDMMTLMDGVGSEPPILRIRFDRGSYEKVRVQRLLLQRISRRTTPTTLDIFVRSTLSPFAQDDITIANALHCVGACRISYLDFLLDEVWGMVLWLKHLPRLRFVEINPLGAIYEQEVVQKLIEEMQTALPGVTFSKAMKDDSSSSPHVPLPLMRLHVVNMLYLPHL